MSEELNSSKLGTLDYWEQVYEDEINNFEDHGDVGEVWFGKINAQKVVKCIVEDLELSKNDLIMDLGCGNGWTLIQLAKRGFNNLLGVDYSPKAVELAKAVLQNAEINGLTIDIMLYDILQSNQHNLPSNLKLIHDKGTYDAICLNPDNRQEKRMKYVENVHHLLAPNGYFVISSCNWTKDELISHFENYFVMTRALNTPEITFAGKKGQSVTNLIFKKK